MPAILLRYGQVRRQARRPDTSRHIVCKRNRQRLPQPRAVSGDARLIAGANSASQKGTGGSRIPKDCPCVVSCDLQDRLEVTRIVSGSPIAALDDGHPKSAATPQLHNNFAAKAVQERVSSRVMASARRQCE